MWDAGPASDLLGRDPRCPPRARTTLPPARRVADLSPVVGAAQGTVLFILWPGAGGALARTAGWTDGRRAEAMKIAFRSEF